MNDQIFSRDFHQEIQSNMEAGFREFVEDLREDLQKGFETDVVDIDFLDQLNDIVHDEIFDNFTPLKFYWLNLVDNLIYVIQLHEELLLEDDIDSEELAEIENELFEFWNDSELAESFLNYLNDGSPVIEASNNLIPLHENQIISFYVMHLNNYRQEFADALMYQVVPELGDFEKRIYLTDFHVPVDLKKVPDTFPSLPVLSISPEEGKLVLEIDNKPVELRFEKETTPIMLEEKALFIVPRCEDGVQRCDEFRKSVQKALATIRKAAPHLYDTFKSFTHTVVPINEQEIISYSLQALPGYSCINMFDRDLIDLMEDLLHENGHHYLNTLLNHLELINEDGDRLYYSPWKRSALPIKNIYHSVFTYFWAFELFKCLNKASEEKTLNFNKTEKIKIKVRFLEEYFILESCRADLAHAHKNKRISKEGNQIMSMILDRVAYSKIEVAPVMNELKALDAEAHKKIIAMKESLAQERSLHKLV